MLTKILFTIGLIGAVLVAFRKFGGDGMGGGGRGSGRSATKRAEPPGPRRAEDMVACPECGAYRLPDAPCDCGAGAT